MSTEYLLLDRPRGYVVPGESSQGGPERQELLLLESSSRASLIVDNGGDFDEGPTTVASNLTADEIARMAVEMLKVASYLDPEAINRTAQYLGEKPDWDYYQETIRGLL